jgi:hypothetical protein
MARDRAILFGSVAALVLAVAALLVSSARQRTGVQPPDLDRILVFSDPSQCRTGEPLTRIVQALSAFDSEAGRRAEDSVVVPGFAEPQRLHRVLTFGVGRDAAGFDSLAQLDIQGLWHGLRVVGLRATSGTNPEIRFAESPERVRETLSRAGFPLPAVDQWRQPDYSADSPAPMTSVQSRRGGASLYCEPVGI